MRFCTYWKPPEKSIYVNNCNLICNVCLKFSGSSLLSSAGKLGSYATSLGGTGAFGEARDAIAGAEVWDVRVEGRGGRGMKKAENHPRRVHHYSFTNAYLFSPSGNRPARPLLLALLLNIAKIKQKRNICLLFSPHD